METAICSLLILGLGLRLCWLAASNMESQSTTSLDWLYGIREEDEYGILSSSTIFDGRIEGELSDDGYQLGEPIFWPTSSIDDDDRKTIQGSASLLDDLRAENRLLKDWLSLVAGDSKLAIEMPEILKGSHKQRDKSSYIYGSPVGSLHCEALFDEQVSSLDFSAVAPESTRNSIARNVVNELKKQHHNCLIQTSYIELQNELHKIRLDDQSQDRATSLRQSYQQAKAECDQSMFQMAGENHDLLQDKEAEYHSKVLLREAGFKQRIALKEMGCEFTVSMKEEECEARIAVKEIECQAKSASVSRNWEKALPSVMDGLDMRFRDIITTTHKWIEENWPEAFRTT